jgi:hypothetical protein
VFEAQSLTHLSLFFAHDVQVCYGTAVEHRSRLGVCWIDLVFCDRINCSNIFLFIQPFWVLKTAFNWVNIHLLFNIMLLIQWSVNVFVGHVVILLVEDQLSPSTNYRQLARCSQLLASACEFSGHYLQKTIINGDKADSKILHLYLG